MKKNLNSKQISISIGEIQGIDPRVKDISSIITMQSYAERLSIFSADSVKSLLLLHPIFLIKQDEKYLVISGFRSYQLAMTHLDLRDKIKAFLLPDIDNNFIQELASTDLLCSALLHSLGTKTVTQIDKIKSHLDTSLTKKLIPKLNSTRAITRFESLE